MAKRYGGVSIFITIAPDSINNPTCFCLALKHTNNKTFIQQPTNTFLKSITNNSTCILEKDVIINCDYANRANLLIQNPLPAVLEYINIIYNLFTILFGIKPESYFPSIQTTPPVRSVYFKTNNKNF